MKTYQYKPADFIRHIILAWLTAVIIENGMLPYELRSLAVLDGFGQMSLVRLVIITAAVSALLFGLSRRWNGKTIERIMILVQFCVLVILFVPASYTKEFFIVCLCIVSALTMYACYGADLSLSSRSFAEEEKENPVYKRIVIMGTVFVFFLLVVWTAARVSTFSTPTYDFGIFSQMFHHMKETGLPMTTLERDGLLSHFHVHVSPIYYLMLPFYMLFPEPVTLQVLQAAVMVLAVVPLWKIGKHHGLTDRQTMFACLILLFYPAFAGGAGYDIHENCFLTMLLLWLFYGMDRERFSIILPAGILTLFVKEDAAVYVAVAALWYFVKNIVAEGEKKKKNLLVGAFLLGIAIVYFLFVTGFLAKIGDGVMTYRYNNFIYDGSGSLLTVIKAVILNPMKALFECVDTEKIDYLFMTMMPLLGLPLVTRKYDRYILMIPYVLINLMSDYTYQHEIFFQYNFGSVAFLIYLYVINLADWKNQRHRNMALILSLLLSILCFSVTVLPKADTYVNRMVRYEQHYSNIRSILSTIPDDASVTATTFYTTELSKRPVLYDVRYSSTEHLLETEYIALDIRQTGDFKKYETDGKENGYENLKKILLENGYELSEMMEGIVEIYKK